MDVGVTKLMFETQNNTLSMYTNGMRKTRYQRKDDHNISNTGSLKQQVYMSINYNYLVSVVHNSSL